MLESLGPSARTSMPGAVSFIRTDSVASGITGWMVNLMGLVRRYSRGSIHHMVRYGRQLEQVFDS